MPVHVFSKTLLGTVLLLLAFGKADAQSPAATWDGTWGRPDAITVTVSGDTVAYYFKGRQNGVYNVRRSPSELSFNFGTGGQMNMKMNPDGTAQYAFSLPTGGTGSGKIWRRR